MESPVQYQLNSLSKRLHSSMWWDIHEQVKFSFVNSRSHHAYGQIYIRAAHELHTGTYLFYYVSEENAYRLKIDCEGGFAGVYTLRFSPGHLELIPIQSQRKVRTLRPLGPFVVDSMDHLQYSTPA